MFLLIRLVWTFYRNFLLFSALITGFCIRAFWLGGFSSFFGVFWCKVASLGLTYYFVSISKKNEFYYYQNFGISKKLLWTVTLTVDFIIFIVLIIISNKFR